MLSDSFVRIVNDVDGQIPSLLNYLEGKKGRGTFVLSIASSESSDVEGISAAGASAELRRLTPTIDAEALVLGKPSGAATLPVSPAGVVSPVVITRACLDLAGLTSSVVDCGAFHSPSLPNINRIGDGQAKCVSTGSSQSYESVQELFQAGLSFGFQLSDEVEYLILGECVPAGTTTAFGVLSALGINCAGLVSSSVVNSEHNLKGKLVGQGLLASGLSTAEFLRHPLKAVAAVGDPMQPYVAGIAAAASLTIPVILGGGSQMLAVYALIGALIQNHFDGFSLPEKNNVKLKRQLSVITTKWVVDDRSANVALLSRKVGAPLACACPDFGKSRHPGLRSYEEGNVKEGVAAGASMAVAHLAGLASEDQIMASIDNSYDAMVTLPI